MLFFVVVVIVDEYARPNENVFGAERP